MPDERQANQNVLSLEKRQGKQGTRPNGTGEGQGAIDPADALAGFRSDAQEPGYRGQRAAWAVTRIAELEAALRETERHICFSLLSASPNRMGGQEAYQAHSDHGTATLEAVRALTKSRG